MQAENFFAFTSFRICIFLEEHLKRGSRGVEVEIIRRKAWITNVGQKDGQNFKAFITKNIREIFAALQCFDKGVLFFRLTKEHDFSKQNEVNFKVELCCNPS